MYANLAPAGTRWTLAFTRELPHPPEKVWQAITEPEHLRAWFPARIDGERKLGARLTFVFENDEGPQLEGEMLRFEPPSLLEFTWDDEILRFTLTPNNGGTRLEFLNTFDDLGKAARDGAGWHECLDRLDRELAGEKPSWDAEQRWTELNDAYQSRFGPEASTEGPPEGHSFD